MRDFSARSSFLRVPSATVLSLLGLSVLFSCGDSGVTRNNVPDESAKEEGENDETPVPEIIDDNTKGNAKVVGGKLPAPAPGGDNEIAAGTETGVVDKAKPVTGETSKEIETSPRVLLSKIFKHTGDDVLTNAHFFSGTELLVVGSSTRTFSGVPDSGLSLNYFAKFSFSGENSGGPLSLGVSKIARAGEFKEISKQSSRNATQHVGDGLVTLMQSKKIRGVSMLDLSPELHLSTFTKCLQKNCDFPFNTVNGEDEVFSSTKDTAGNRYFAGTNKKFAVGAKVFLAKLSAKGKFVWRKELSVMDSGENAVGNMMFGSAGEINLIFRTTGRLEISKRRGVHVVSFSSQGEILKNSNFEGSHSGVNAFATQKSRDGHAWVNITTSGFVKLGRDGHFEGTIVAFGTRYPAWGGWEVDSDGNVVYIEKMANGKMGVKKMENRGDVSWHQELNLVANHTGAKALWMAEGKLLFVTSRLENAFNPLSAKDLHFLVVNTKN